QLVVAAKEAADQPSARAAAAMDELDHACGVRRIDEVLDRYGLKAPAAAEDVGVVVGQHHRLAGDELADRRALDPKLETALHDVVERHNLLRLDHEGPAVLGSHLAGHRPGRSELGVHEDATG